MVRARRTFRHRIPRTITPDHRIVKMAYSETITLDAPSGGFGTHIFRATSVNDPDYTGLGHQPFGHDTLSSMYEKYIVLGAVAKCTVMNTNNGITDGLFLCGSVEQNPGVPAAAGLHHWIEGKVGPYKIIAPASTVGNKALGSIRLKYSPRKTWGIKDPMDIGHLKAAIGTNPSENAHFVFAVAAFRGLDNPTAVTCHVTLNYIVKYFERKMVDQS